MIEKDSVASSNLMNTKDFVQYGEPRFRGLERRFVRTLIAGFGVVLIMMVISGLIGLRAVQRIDDGTNALTERHLRETSLIDELSRQQANLGMQLYAMADEDSSAELQRLSSEFQAERGKLQRIVENALAGKPGGPEREAWGAVQRAASPLFDEIDNLLSKRRNNSEDLAVRYRAFTKATVHLMDASYDDASRSRTAQMTVDAGELQSARNLLVVALVLAGICAALSVAGAITSFHRLERHADVLAKLSLHTLARQEEHARRFSQEMHDEFGQTLNAIGSTLSVVRARDDEGQARLADAVGLVKEAQSMARDLSHVLRPRILDDFGLDDGLRELARNFSQRTGIAVDYRSRVRERLGPVVETHLFRIAQEALTNTSRHTLATNVEIDLEREGAEIRLTIADNGGGLASNGQNHHGLGLLGMRERAQAVGGELTVRSRTGEGLTIRATVPVAQEVPA